MKILLQFIPAVKKSHLFWYRKFPPTVPALKKIIYCFTCRRKLLSKIFYYQNAHKRRVYDHISDKINFICGAERYLWQDKGVFLRTLISQSAHDDNIWWNGAPYIPFEDLKTTVREKIIFLNFWNFYFHRPKMENSCNGFLEEFSNL